MTSCTYDMPNACSVALETYHGASTIILRILDWRDKFTVCCPFEPPFYLHIHTFHHASHLLLSLIQYSCIPHFLGEILILPNPSGRTRPWRLLSL
jgi:hypothetical protein